VFLTTTLPTSEEATRSEVPVSGELADLQSEMGADPQCDPVVRRILEQDTLWAPGEVGDPMDKLVLG